MTRRPEQKSSFVNAGPTRSTVVVDDAKARRRNAELGAIGAYPHVAFGGQRQAAADAEAVDHRHDGEWRVEYGFDCLPVGPLEFGVLVRVRLRAAVAGGALQVVAGGEGKTTLAFDDQASRLAFLGQPVDVPDHLRVDLRIEGVSLFRPIDGERGYIAVLLHD